MGATSQRRQLHLVHTEILSVTTSIRKYTRIASSSSLTSSSSSSLGFGGSSSSASSSHSHTVPLGSHSAALSGTALAHARRKLTSFGADHTLSDGPDPNAGLRSALSARAKEMETTPDAPRSSSSSSLNESLEPSALLHSFTILRAQLKEHPDLASFPLPLLLAPFLHVILSPRVSAPVTSAALQSVTRLLVYQVVPLPSGSSSHPRVHRRDANLGLSLAVSDIARAISHCRFEPSEPAVDELVLLRIMAVMKEVVCGAKQTAAEEEGLTLADLLPDESICEMMETALSMCCQTRLSDLLRKTAEQNLLPMVRRLFSRLPNIPLTSDEAFDAENEIPPDHTSLAADDVEEVASAVDVDEKKLRRMTMPDPRGLQVNPPNEAGEPQPPQALSSDEGVDEVISEDAPADATESTEEPTSTLPAAATTLQPVQTPRETEQVIVPFALPAIKEVLRVIISLLDPLAQSHNDSMRLLGLNLLTAVFETSGPQLARFPSLRAQVQDTACKHLLQLTRSESFAISSYAIRCICTMFDGMKEELKLQYELLLTSLLDRLAPLFPMSQEPWQDSLHAIAAVVPGRNMPLRSGSLDPAGRSGTPDPTAAAAPPPPPPPPMPRTSDKAPAHGDVRDLTLEALALLLGVYRSSSEDPLLELFLNFDCDVDCEDLYARAIQFLCRSVFASPPAIPPSYGQAAPATAPAQDGVQVFALDVILSFVERLTARREQAQNSPWPDDFPGEQTLQESRGRKDAILEGARRFNTKPKDGLAYFETQGFIAAASSPQRDQSIARFFMQCPRLDKKLLGDYISRPDNIGVLEAFIRLFDFAGKPLSEAMREMLESFRLPGESQQINRIAEVFSKVYFATSPKDIKSEDAVYVLAYSVIMLNTDLHNSQNKRKMKVEDYRRNLRGVNDGADFDPDYLGSIYENIRKREIVMPEEHVGQLGFEYAWKELLRKSRTSTKLKCPATNRFDRDMFASAWKPMVACIAHAFSTFKDEHLLERAISGFRQCALLASEWGMDEVFDFMIEGLSHNTGLLDSSGLVPTGSPANATVDVEGTKVSVSPLSVRFGMDFKGQLAAVVLFTIANGNGEAIRAGWTPVFEIFKNLFAAGLLPDHMASMLDVGTHDAPLRPSAARDGDGTETPKAAASTSTNRTLIPFKPKKTAGIPQPDPRAQGGGLFSTLSSYLLSPYSNASEPAAPEVTEADVESSLCTVDCVASCRIEELYSQLLSLQQRDSVVSAVRSLRQLADRLTLGQLAANAASQQQDGGRSTPVGGSGSNANGHAGSGASASGSVRSNPLQQLPYDPRVIFVLEILTNVTCSTPQHIDATWPEAAAHVQSLLQSPKNFHPALLERAVVCLLRLVDVAKSAGSSDASLQASIAAAVELLRTLPSDVRPALSPAIIGSLQYILSTPRQTAFVDDAAVWDGLLSLVSDSLTTRTSKSIELAYSLISTVAKLHLSLDNFVSTVQLLRDVAQAADPEPMLRDIHKREKQGYRLTLTEKKELTEYVEACRAKGPLAVKRLEDIKLRVPDLVASSGTGSAWSQCWLPLTSAIASQCINAHKGTRQEALTALQRVLFSDELSPKSSPPLGLRQIFLTALFPILDQLVPLTDSGAGGGIFSREQDPAAPGGLFETRLRACALLCRTTLHFLEPLHTSLSSDEFQDLWTQVLDWMERFYTTEGNGSMVEAVPENVKNVLLVLHATGVLVPPPSPGQMDTRSPEQAAFWAVTFDRLDKFLPPQVTTSMRDDLAPVSAAQQGAGEGDADPSGGPNGGAEGVKGE